MGRLKEFVDGTVFLCAASFPGVAPGLKAKPYGLATLGLDPGDDSGLLGRYEKNLGEKTGR